MLDMIKNIINSKEDLLESVDIIYEDAIDDIENYIIENDDPDDSDEDDDDDMDEDDNEKSDDDDEKSDVVMDSPLNDDLKSSMDDLENMPINDDMGDIANIELNMASNNVTDILPVPPMNASDAVVSDVMDMDIDDGFDNDSGNTPEPEPKHHSALDDDLVLFNDDENSVSFDEGGGIFKRSRINDTIDKSTKNRNDIVDKVKYNRVIVSIEKLPPTLQKTLLDDLTPSIISGMTAGINAESKLSKYRDDLIESTKVDYNITINKKVETINNGALAIIYNAIGIIVDYTSYLGNSGPLNNISFPFEFLQPIIANVCNDINKNILNSSGISISPLAATDDSIGIVIMLNSSVAKDAWDFVHNTPYTEAILIDAKTGDDASDVKSDESTNNEHKSADEDDNEVSGESNDVTAAVIDKVNEAETDVTSNDNRDKLLNKLDKLNKDILDLKENVKKHIS